MTRKTKKTVDTSNSPYVSSYPPLRDWLDKHDARCMWQTPREPKPYDVSYDWEPQAYIECWMIAGHQPFILTIHNNKMGWEIYTNGNTPKVSETLADAERRLGLVAS